MHPLLQRFLKEAVEGFPAAGAVAGLEDLPALLPEALLDMMAVARLYASSASKKAFACGIINAKSGNCTENCCFCAQSMHHATAAPVYPRVTLDQLQHRADELAGAGAAYMGIVISGRGPSPRDVEFFCSAVSRLSRTSGVQFCASLGILVPEQAVALKQAGFSSYHHNLESSHSFFPSVCTTHSYEARLDTVRHAREAGLRVCSGGIFGMGESWAQRVELVHTLRELKVDSVPLNFLTAIQGTPLEGRPPMSSQEALAIIALMRLGLPETDILICGGRKAVLDHWENLVFSAGANGLMIGNYLTTTGGSFEADSDMLRTLGVGQ